MTNSEHSLTQVTLGLPELPDLPTPCVVVDLDRLEANIAAMADRAQAAGMALRPHAKTHKCAEIARRQLTAGAVGLTVATVGEAEFFASHGCADLFVAYPLWVDERKARRLRAVAETSALAVGVDSSAGAEALARWAGPDCADVLVEVDSGHHRTGIAPDRAGEVAAAAARAGLTVRGAFTFPGHSYSPDLTKRAAADEAAALAAAAAAIRKAGIGVDVLSGGSTPSAAFSRDPVTELRPGVYVFGDAQQVELGTCGFGDVALAVHATVVSRGPGRVTLDAGGKALGADRASWSTGLGRLPDVPDARFTALSEHHATVAWPQGSPLAALGTRLRVIPNHVCACVNLTDELTVVSGGEVVDRWPVGARGLNT